MILIDNITYFKKKFFDVWKIVNEQPDRFVGNQFSVEVAKNGQETLSVQAATGLNYIHSKYDPVAEAEKIIAPFMEDVGEKHIVFYGVGLGYHVEAFIRRHPNATYSLYEPNMEVFYKFLCTKKMSKVDNGKLKNLYIGMEDDLLTNNLRHFVDQVNGEVIFIILPTYERIFSEQTKKFIEEFRDKVFLKRATMSANLTFAKRLTVNSIKNMPTIIRTPNILNERPTELIGKPAILVAAGPSLDYEYENLRHIKENGLAYIFSVGSSINSLIENGIYPDAACTYDGSVENEMVFEKLIEREISSIPLLYGSIVGHELIPKYPGPMSSFIVARDTLAPLYLKRQDGEKIDVVDSSRSIAIITLQLLYKLGCNPIILVGQNLAYVGDMWYSKDISYAVKVDERQRREAIVVKDVEGNDAYTNRGLDMFRKEMEVYVNLFTDLEVINTTKGGAHISGTTYIPLKTVMEERLQTKNIVSDKWVDKKDVQYDLDHFRKQAEWMKELQGKLDNVYGMFDHILYDMEYALKRKNTKELERLFNKFDKAFDKLQANHFFVLLIQSMNTTEFEFIMKMFKELRFSKDTIAKAERVVKEFRSYLANCKIDIEKVNELLEIMHEEVDEYAACVK